MKPVELAKKLGIQLWTPVYRRGKGVAMSPTIDGSYIHLVDLTRIAEAQPSSNEEKLREGLRQIASIIGESDALGALPDQIERIEETANTALREAERHA